MTIGLVLSLCFLAGWARADRVDRRGGEPALIGSISMLDGGVLVQTDLGARHFSPQLAVRRYERHDHRLQRCASRRQNAEFGGH